jgi:drug/metabolite transporter (DMT)-like permease
VPALLAALSAAGFGVGDFLGGLSARRMAVMLTTIAAQLTGLVLLVALALVGDGTPQATDWAWGAAAGASGAVALLLFYGALAAGQMSVVAPVSAVMAALVPFVAGLGFGERPAPLALAGAVLTLPAIALIAREPRDPAGPDERDHPEQNRPGGRRSAGQLPSALGSGLGFGLFFVFISRSGDDSGLWPLTAARGTAVVLVGIAALLARPGRPTGPGLRLAALAGCCDSTANALFLVASRQGLLTLVGVIGSLYPASTVLLARFVLGERLAAHQIVGMGCAVAAVSAIAVA